MTIDFKKLNREYDLKGLNEDAKEVRKNGGSFEELPPGEYEVALNSLELKLTGEKSKTPGAPMASFCFKVVSDTNKGRLIFWNQVLTQGFQIDIVLKFLESLETEAPIDCDGSDWEAFNEMLLDVAECMDGMEFLLEIKENNKGFRNYEVIEIYE